MLNDPQRPAVTDALAAVRSWPVTAVAAAVVDDSGRLLGSCGDVGRPFLLASVTKLFTATAALVAVQEGAVELTDPVGPAGVTLAHLLAHAGGIAPDEPKAVTAPGSRRIYSNAGFELVAAHVAERTGIAFADYLRDAVFAPLGMTSARLDGSPAHGAMASVADVLALAGELLRPTLLDASIIRTATGVAFPGLPGVLPGFGRQADNAWGLGFEIRAAKSPHWTGTANSPGTYGHFGQTGTFCWVDPEARIACVCLTDRDFGDWALERWPALSDAVIAAAS